MKRNLDGLAGHPKRIANHLPGKPPRLWSRSRLCSRCSELAVFRLAIFTVVFVMPTAGDDEQNEQGQN